MINKHMTRHAGNHKLCVKLPICLTAAARFDIPPTATTNFFITPHPTAKNKDAVNPQHKSDAMPNKIYATIRKSIFLISRIAQHTCTYVYMDILRLIKIKMCLVDLTSKF